MKEYGDWHKDMEECDDWPKETRGKGGWVGGVWCFKLDPFLIMIIIISSKGTNHKVFLNATVVLLFCCFFRWLFVCLFAIVRLFVCLLVCLLLFCSVSISFLSFFSLLCVWSSSSSSSSSFFFFFFSCQNDAQLSLYRVSQSSRSSNFSARLEILNCSAIPCLIGCRAGQATGRETIIMATIGQGGAARDHRYFAFLTQTLQQSSRCRLSVVHHAGREGGGTGGGGVTEGGVKGKR